MKKILMRSMIFLTTVLLIGVGTVVWLTSNMETLETVTLSQNTFTDLEDGTYMGHCSEGRWTTSVEVTVEEGSITSITLIEDVTIPEEGVFNQIKESVLTENSLDVDAVSGATLTSNAYLTAIDDALEEASRE